MGRPKNAKTGGSLQGLIAAATVSLRTDLKIQKDAANHWMKEAGSAHNNLVRLQAKTDLYADLLNRVAASFTRDDDRDNLLPEIDAALEDPMVAVSELGEGQENHCPHCGAEPGQMCSTREGREYGGRVHEARKSEDSPPLIGGRIAPLSPAEPLPCSHCWGMGWVPSVYNDKLPCSFCNPKSSVKPEGWIEP